MYTKQNACEDLKLKLTLDNTATDGKPKLEEDNNEEVIIEEKKEPMILEEKQDDDDSNDTSDSDKKIE